MSLFLAFESNDGLVHSFVKTRDEVTLRKAASRTYLDF